MAKKSNPDVLDIIAHFPKEEAFVKRIWELMKQVDYKSTVALTPFLTPDKIAIAKQLVGKQYRIQTNGFYEEAEAKKLAITSLYDQSEINFGICQIVTRYQPKFIQISHRDVLGALMQLGIEREQFGDIAIGENEIGIAVNETQAKYIMANLSQIHRLNVTWEIKDVPISMKREYDMITSIVSSMRLDTLTADLAKVSRSKAKEMIESGLVKVNHSDVENGEKVCHNKDIISIRGCGRFQIDEMKGTTKKGNVVVVIRQFK